MLTFTDFLISFTASKFVTIAAYSSYLFSSGCKSAHCIQLQEPIYINIAESSILSILNQIVRAIPRKLHFQMILAQMHLLLATPVPFP